MDELRIIVYMHSCFRWAVWHSLELFGWVGGGGGEVLVDGANSNDIPKRGVS
jgi:hypothetical protein